MLSNILVAIPVHFRITLSAAATVTTITTTNTTTTTTTTSPTTSNRYIKMRWTGHGTRMSRLQIHKILSPKPRPLAKSGNRYKDNIKTELQERGNEGTKLPISLGIGKNVSCKCGSIKQREFLC